LPEWADVIRKKGVSWSGGEYNSSPGNMGTTAWFVMVHFGIVYRFDLVVYIQSIHPSIIYPSIHLSICHSCHLSINQSIHLFIYI
jgi:hypothetical protein